MPDTAAGDVIKLLRLPATLWAIIPENFSQAPLSKSILHETRTYS